MSRESMEWLNRNVLVGFTDQRGHAWHYLASAQGLEPNHYPAAVPVEDVRRRLFGWTAEETPVLVPAAGGTVNGYNVIPNTKAIRRSDTGDVLGIFKDGYQPHQPNDWLIGVMADLLGEGLQVGSAGLLRRGAVAWLQAELAENMVSEGFAYRPHLTASTSFDGTLRTTYQPMVTAVVCDNTLAAGQSEGGPTYRVKHTRNSQARITDARQALGLVEMVGERFSDRIRHLTTWTVPTRAWSMLLDAVVPVPDEPGRARTVAEHKRDQLGTLYAYDPRCAPWTGTALGVLQAYNTYQHHYQTVRGAERAERNMLNALNGVTEEADAIILAELAKVVPEPVAA